MECPYCHKEAEKGFIYTREGSLKWIEESKDKGVFFNAFASGVVMRNYEDLNKIEAYYCKDCKKMIIDVVE
ncbi:PF20097 family protein [Clostridium folliculivorans]|uniref:DUF6487 domain-containing protein n=1 Tax=Clostridium folliculivorans TaxID=2886038 RepID=A0A9W5Y075_9CLOT|nr:PF20097 family protein [Clostridium folliculivorans]GKU24110.1 hypothetical protein CFOLD11_09360 [Clostridium folliculivorans]GKU30216.1 hypothetical protein CFB3_23230 [Clostridium folliculivorans]